MSGKSCGGLDAFRLGASFLVVAIHTSPLASFTLTGDFFLTRVAGRLAVPFFFMVTGHFVLSGPLFGDGNRTRIYRMVKKLLQLYALAILLYLPLGWYAGHYQGLTLGDLLRLLVFDGTFYHLWYFPACALGLLLVLCLDRLGKKGLFAGAGVLYLLGLLGDSYFGLTGFCPPLRQGYEGMFQLFSYTRNGLFFAPLFLLLGACLGHREPPAQARPWAAGFLCAFGGMTGEAFLLQHLDFPRHDSMYLLLPVCMACLYQLLLTSRRPPAPAWRSLSTGIYLIHPAVIAVVHGMAKVLDCTEVFVENSLVHYTVVCLLSLAAVWIFQRIRARAVLRLS